jgi:hypothetical protein
MKHARKALVCRDSRHTAKAGKKGVATPSLFPKTPFSLFLTKRKVFPQTIGGDRKEMNTEEKKCVMRGIIDQLEQEYHVKIVPEKEVLEIGFNEVGLDNMSELVTELLESNFIFRPAAGKLALTQTREQNDQRSKTVKVVVSVERNGEEIRRVRYDDWLDTLTIKEIIEEITAAIGSIDEV